MAKPKCTYDADQSKPAKVWHFLAREDSWQSFIVDAIIVILIGKYLLFPGLGLVLGTQFPVVAVVSGSMDHQGMQFGNWWGDHGAWYEKRNITKEQFQTFYKPNGFVKGDVFIVFGLDGGRAKIGDVLIYNIAGKKDPIIHRVIKINSDGTFQTKGDANYDQLAFEASIRSEQVAGKAALWIPKIGWVKVLAVELVSRILNR